MQMYIQARAAHGDPVPGYQAQANAQQQPDGQQQEQQQPGNHHLADVNNG